MVWWGNKKNLYIKSPLIWSYVFSWNQNLFFSQVHPSEQQHGINDWKTWNSPTLTTDIVGPLFSSTMKTDKVSSLWFLGPVVQSAVSLTSSLVVKMLTALVSTISKSQVFLLTKMWVAFVNVKATHIFFSKNNSVYAIFNDQCFNDSLTNDIVSFEQLVISWKTWAIS